jgi:predicted phage terminase large subunit-like protein
LNDYERLRTDDPKEYDNIVLGGWVSELVGQVFPIGSLKRYKEFPENMEYYTVGYIDSADTGEDYFAMPIARIYQNRIYVFDAIFDQCNLTIQESQVQNKVRTHHINEIAVETNSFGAYFGRRLRELMPDLEVFGVVAKANKMGRIIANSGLVKRYFYFPEDPNETLKLFMDQMVSLTNTSKDKDDAPDSTSGLCAYLEYYKKVIWE